MTVWKITGKIIRIAITITCAQLQSAVLTILGVGRFLSFVLHISYTFRKVKLFVSLLCVGAYVQFCLQKSSPK